MATNGNVNHHDQYAQPTEAVAGADTSNNQLATDEIGWYFVEQYYTTVSKSPERLHVSHYRTFRIAKGAGLIPVRSCSMERRPNSCAAARPRLSLFPSADR